MTSVKIINIPVILGVYFFIFILFQTLATEMLENYFHPTDQSKIVSLENSALRKKCGNELSNVALSLTGSTIPEKSMNHLKKASIYMLQNITFLSLN